MNLKTIRTAIRNRVDIDNHNVEWHKFLNTIINQKYQEIWHERQWTFSVKEEQLPVYPDITPKDVSAVYADLVQHGSTPPTPSADVLTDAYAYVTHGSITVDLGDGSIDVVHTWDANQIIEIEGVEYGIQSVPATNRVYLDTPYLGENGSTLNWKIKHRWIPLPIDCAELLSMAWTDAPVPGCPLAAPLALTSKLFSFQLLRNDATSMRPTHYILTPDEYVPAPSEDLAPTVTLSTYSTGGYLPAGDYYFTYSYVKGEPTYDYPYIPEGPLWGGNDTYPEGYVHVNVPTPGVNTIAITVDLPETVNITGDAAEAWQYYAKLYAVKPLYDGRIVAYEIPTADSTGPLVVDNGSGTYHVTAASFARKSYIRAPYQGGSSKKIQLFPRPINPDISITIDPEDPYFDKKLSYITVNYIYHPPDLLEDTDSTIIPAEFTDLIVQRCIAIIHQRNGNISSALAADRQAEGIHKRLLTRYGDHKALVVRKGKSWGSGYPTNRMWPYSNPATYNGDF